MSARAMAAAPAVALTAGTAPAGVLQRKCACGGTPGPSGECAECQRKRLALQRRTTGSAGPDVAPPIVHDVLRSAGTPLDGATRSRMEAQFGHDFGRVRVHTDARGAASARAVEAHAYTVGQHVVMGAGRYRPETSEGRRLLAHELTHTIQQDGTGGALQSLAIDSGSRGSAAEREADAAGVAIAAGDRFAVSQSTENGLARAAAGEEEGWADRTKHRFYKSLIESMRVPQAKLIAGLRRAAKVLPGPLRQLVELDIDVIEGASDIVISLVLALIALQVGIASGLIGLVVSVFRMAAGLVTGLMLAIAGVVTGDFGPLKLWFEDLWNAIKGIPSGLKRLYDKWMAKFSAASTDEQTIMIAELTGEIVALLIPFVLSGGGAGGAAAGEAGAVAGETGAVAGDVAAATGDVAAATGDVAAASGEVGAATETVSTGARFTPTVIEGGGQGAARTSTVVSSGGGRGSNLAYSLAEDVADAAPAARSVPKLVPPLAPEPLPVPVPAPVPAPAVAPAVAPVAETATSVAPVAGGSTAAKVVTGAGVAAAVAAKVAAKGEEDPAKMAAMRFQVQWNTNSKKGKTFSRIALAPMATGVTTVGAVEKLTETVASVAPDSGRIACAPAAAKQIKWIQTRPPAGISIGGYSKSEYFPYKGYTDARVDVENLRGHNLRV